ncbi:hypothetical protein [Undibacterium sp.]|uniref:hypothetical protein n=1 Tax=Undibacterium sp. TaxID=1914977 RepID=UPI002730E3FA|nr:hypothetical protein [Undibacterium sp.]MDP1980292.1 hypothetical protein [Undibacterium sp.]
MSTSSLVQNAMSDNLAFSLMARLHVILRRQNGRVTDIEYMRINPGYCRAILDLAMELPNEALRDICRKLEDIYFGEAGLFVIPPPADPLLNRLISKKSSSTSGMLVSSRIETNPLAGMPVLDHNAMVDQTYIGRLR